MKKLISFLLSFIISFSIITIPYEVIAEINISEVLDGSKRIPIEQFSQGDEDSLADWFTHMPNDPWHHRDYKSNLKVNFTYTVYQMLETFDVGRLDEETANEIKAKYNIVGLTNIYKLDEIQQTFNAMYNTEIDMSQLDGLKDEDSDWEMVKIIDNYFIVMLAPHGMNVIAKADSDGVQLNSATEYWIFHYEEYGETSMTKSYHAIISHKNVAGYNIRSIEYLDFTSPSDKLLASYINGNTNEAKKDEGVAFGGVGDVTIMANNVDGIQQFRRVVPVGDIVYTTDFLANDGNITFKTGDVEVIKLPNMGPENREICSFTIYKDRVYFVSGYNGSDYSRAEIYSCKLDGSGYKYIAGNASNYSTCFINGDYIYYDQGIEDGISGIYKVTLDGSYAKRIVAKEHSQLSLCEKDKIYYNANGKNYSCDLDGNNNEQMAEYYDKCAGFGWSESSVINPNIGKYYHITKGILWETDAMTRNSDNLISVEENARVVAVTDEAVYYAQLVPNDKNGQYAYINKYDLNSNVSSSISVVLNDTVLSFDQPPIIHNDRTLVPLRAIFEALGAAVDWDGNTKTVTAKKDDITITLTIGNYYFYKNGQKIDIDVPGMIVNDRTLVPVRAISEAFNCDVEWDGTLKKVYIYANVRDANSNLALSNILDKVKNTQLSEINEDVVSDVFHFIGIPDARKYISAELNSGFSFSDKLSLGIGYSVSKEEIDSNLDQYIECIEETYGKGQKKSGEILISWLFENENGRIFLDYNKRNETLSLEWDSDDLTSLYY